MTIFEILDKFNNSLSDSKGLVLLNKFILIELSNDSISTLPLLIFHIKSGSHPNKEYLPLCSPPSTDSSKKEYFLFSEILSNVDIGVSVSAII